MQHCTVAAEDVSTHERNLYSNADSVQVRHTVMMTQYPEVYMYTGTPVYKCFGIHPC